MKVEKMPDLAAMYATHLYLSNKIHQLERYRHHHQNDLNECEGAKDRSDLNYTISSISDEIKILNNMINQL